MLAPAITNALTIDVEDYFQVSAFAPYIRRDEWDARECRVERNVERILAMLAARDVKATFFTLGWIAERYPHVVRDIVAQGHELASHGYGHERASDLSPEASCERTLSRWVSVSSAGAASTRLRWAAISSASWAMRGQRSVGKGNGSKQRTLV